MIKLYGKTLSELQEITAYYNLPKFTAKQIADWLYKKHITQVGDMSNLSKKARELLEKEYIIGLEKPITESVSNDGTKKYLFKIDDLKFIETAYIPEKERATVCVSSQVGCKMNCLFCSTGKQGFQANLSTNEILNQLQSLPDFDKITNIVYMGMGEPFDNLENVLKSLEILTADWGYAMSPKRITVSTIGIVPAMKRFLDESKVHLAVSLHSPYDDERRKLMPVQKKYKLEEVLAEIKSFEFNRQRRVSFEYIVFKGLNDSKKHAQELARILKGIKCRINLIRYHSVPGVPLETTDENVLLQFQNELKSKGIVTTIRASRGQDIDAACGLLSTKQMINSH
jgi:23S rRNA (adenine2503-C2)-methyltransferase